MKDDVEHKSCEQCSQKIVVSELMIDEETGMLLCPLCSREQENCGCSDEND